MSQKSLIKTLNRLTRQEMNMLAHEFDIPIVDDQLKQIGLFLINQKGSGKDDVDPYLLKEIAQHLSSNDIEALSMTNRRLAESRRDPMIKNIVQQKELEEITQFVNRYKRDFSTLEWSQDVVQSLEQLNLNGNWLKSLPKSIGQLIHLRELNLNNNSLTKLPETIGKLTNLQKLLVRNNELTNLPESIGQLTKLEVLDLNVNKLTTLPKSINQLKNLQVLLLGENELTHIPESIGQLKNLQELSLRDNQFKELTELPDWIWDLPKLRILRVYGHPIIGKYGFGTKVKSDYQSDDE